MITNMLLAVAALCAIPLAAQVSEVPAPTEAAASAVSAPRFDYVQLRTGVRLRYAEQGNPDGEPVILLHGLTDSWFSFSRVMPLLPASLRVFALDQRGHGDSDRPAGGYTVADFAEDVLAFLDAMEIDQATVIGHSMGAFVAQRVAIIAPDRVERLVLLGGAPSARNDVMFGLQSELAALPGAMPDDFLRAFQYSTVHAPVPTAFIDAAIRESAKVPTRVARSATDGLLASGDSARLGSIRAPTLVVWGDRDAIFGQAARAYQRRISGAEMRPYRDVGHAPHWESPDRVVQDLLAFVARTGSR